MLTRQLTWLIIASLMANSSFALKWKCVTPASGSTRIAPQSLPKGCTLQVPKRQPLYSNPDVVSELGLWNQTDCENSGGIWQDQWYWKCDCGQTTFLTMGWRVGEGCVPD